MGLWDLRLKLKGLRLRRLVMGNKRKKRRNSMENKGSWIAPVTHGFQDSDYGSVVVQREQISDLELWFFGVFHSQIAQKTVTKFMQTHLFDKKLKQGEMKRKGKETMEKAHLMRENEGSVSALVIDGRDLIIAAIGDYKAVICEDGFAHQITHSTKHNWPHKFFGMKARRSSEIVVSVERIYSETEFVILASTGVWEVMKNQEAVNLVRHMENPQDAAGCLAKEALTRMSKSSISCLVIRFD